MRTPAGKECKYFYGDYYRGRKHEECRLLGSALPPLPWKPDLCKDCPVPAILMANACPHLVLEPYLTRPFPFLRKQVQVRVVCSKSGSRDFNPYTGCGQCHPLPDEFQGDFL
ncbi:MAG: hypothetical protein IT316_14090 [Anaerolineales bacterium]|nr:hypothetical protein [Anaerolineales bacterium]